MQRKINGCLRFWVLVTVSILTASWITGDLIAQTVHSENGKFEATYDARTDRVSVYRIKSHGSRKRRAYVVEGRLDAMFLSDDGRFLVSCKQRLQSDYRSDEVIIRIFESGTLARSIGLNELEGNPRDLPSAPSTSGNRQYVWGECLGFIGSSQGFQLSTVRGRLFSIRMSSRNIVLSRPSIVGETSSSPNDKVASTKFLIDCNKRPPGTQRPVLCDNLDQYEPGWRQVRGKWEYSTDTDGDKILHQKSDHWREQNALMYFDNQLFSDFDILTYVKIDPEFPTIAIAEDEPRVRQLRRIAGAGLVFRLQDENNYYMFRLAGLEGAVLGKMVDGIWHDLANPRAVDFLTQGKVLDPDQWLGLRVRVRDDNIQCWIVERTTEGDWSEDRWQAVVNTHDKTFTTGRIGLTTFKVKAKFSYVVVFDQ